MVDVPRVLGIVAEGLSTARAPVFKIGTGTMGLLRPHKIVAYFADRDHLVVAARWLEDRLRGTRAHGVPFSAELGGDGLLSWGIDPTGSSCGWGASWRQWITSFLVDRI
jgi:hypothetical protein